MLSFLRIEAKEMQCHCRLHITQVREYIKEVGNCTHMIPYLHKDEWHSEENGLCEYCQKNCNITS